MDLGSVGGLIGGSAAVIIGILWAGSPLGAYFDIPSIFIVVVGSIMSTAIAFPLKKCLGIFGFLRWAFFSKAADPAQTIDMLVTFSEKARREGLLALEDDVSEVSDPFLKKGIQLVVDGTDPELVRNLLSTDLNNIGERHMEGINLMIFAAGIAPAYGMVGTLIGLIAMLRNLEDKASLGPNMAVALITTMYGSLMANLILTPLATKLDSVNKNELMMKEIMIEGTLSIQQGDNPRIVKEKLASYLPPAQRASLGGDERD
ncbi:MAG: motility protein A [Spirochaetota bacterium]|jgi:chemotaxis protein MotA|nr:motility protein A [Spirochaetota bacterium]